MPDGFGVTLIGVRELVREISALDKEVAKQIGLENRRIGQIIIARAVPDPTTSGAGAGAMPRASSAKTSLTIRAGGSHRDQHPRVMQWGRRYVRRETKRSFLVGAAEQHLPNFERMYLIALGRAAKKVGLSPAGRLVSARDVF